MNLLINPDFTVFPIKSLRVSVEKILDHYKYLAGYIKKGSVFAYLNIHEQESLLHVFRYITLNNTEYIAVYEEKLSIYLQHLFDQQLHDFNNAFTTVLVWEKLLEKDRGSLSEDNQKMYDFSKDAIEKMKSVLKQIQLLGHFSRQCPPIKWQDSFFEDLKIALDNKYTILCSNDEEACLVQPLLSEKIITNGLLVAALSDLECFRGQVSMPLLVYDQKPDALCLISAMQQFILLLQHMHSQVQRLEIKV